VGVADDIEVRLPVIDQRPDPDIVRDAVSALKLELPFSSENIKVVAREGWLTLEGAVEWNYARERAESAVKNIRGVKGVTNSIELKPKVAPYEVRRKIEDALRRSAELDASRITVGTAARSSYAVRLDHGRSGRKRNVRLGRRRE
jgi:osmotically-inducible protein OsmY